MQLQPVDTGQTCPSCQRTDIGQGRFCRWCAQFLAGPNGIKNAGLGQRFGALISDNILFFITLVIGYVIWWLIVLGRGQTPGKQLVGIRAIRDDGQPASWGRMFLREFVYKDIVFGILSLLTAGIVWVLEYLWAFWDRDRQTLHDKLAGTVVVQGPR